MPSKPKPLKKKHHARKSTKARVLYVKAFYKCDDEIKDAVAYVKANWHSSFGKVPSNLSRDIQATLGRFEGTGNVADTPRPGRPPKLPTAKAKRAAALLKSGGTTTPTDARSQPGTSKKQRFNTVSEALATSKELHGLLDNSGLAFKSFLRRLKQVDPGLVRRRLDVKPPFTRALRDQRAAAALEWLHLWKKHGEKFTRRLVYLDAATIIVGDPGSARVWVWCDAADPAVQEVHSLGELDPAKAIKIKFYIAVTAEHGPIMFYPTTGTTDLKRRYANTVPNPESSFLVNDLQVGGERGICQPMAVVGAADYVTRGDGGAQQARQRGVRRCARGQPRCAGLEALTQHHSGAGQPGGGLADHQLHQRRPLVGVSICPVHTHQHAPLAPRPLTHAHIALHLLARR